MSSGWAALACVAIVASDGWLEGAARAGDDPPLVAAAAAGDVRAVRDLLAAGAGVDAASVDGATALHWAAHRDLSELVQLLIEAGADVSAGNRYGVQPIALAATNGSAAVLELMAARGLSTEGHVVDPLVCLDCYQTRPDQVRDAIERDRHMAAELAAAMGQSGRDR